jgi:hypothetical protein
VKRDHPGLADRAFAPFSAQLGGGQRQHWHCP